MPRKPKQHVYPIAPDAVYMGGTLKALDENELVAQLARHPIDMVANVGQHDPRIAELTHYRHVRIPDSNKRVPAQEIAAVAEELSRVVVGGGKVLIMCYGGRNRSALLVALVLMRVLRCSGQQAYDMIRAAKPNTFYNELYGDYVRGLPAPEAS